MASIQVRSFGGIREGRLAGARAGFAHGNPITGRDPSGMTTLNETSAVELTISNVVSVARTTKNLLASVQAARKAAQVAARFSGSASGVVRVLQSGGNIIQNGTAAALNELAGTSYHRREWGRFLEALKQDVRLPPNHHGVITSLGEYLSGDGTFSGNLLDYVP